MNFEDLVIKSRNSFSEWIPTLNVCVVMRPHAFAAMHALTDIILTSKTGKGSTVVVRSVTRCSSRTIMLIKKLLSPLPRSGSNFTQTMWSAKHVRATHPFRHNGNCKDDIVALAMHRPTNCLAFEACWQSERRQKVITTAWW